MRPIPVTAGTTHQGTGYAGSDNLASGHVAPSQMTYLMTNEETLEAAGDQIFPHQHSHSQQQQQHGSQKKKSDLEGGGTNKRQSVMSASTSVSWPSPSLQSQSDFDSGVETPQDLSRPMTPVQGLSENYGADSLFGSPSSPMSSLVASMTASLNSSVVNIATPPGSPVRQQFLDSTSATTVPQFIMPSLSVPSRHPFSEIGKCLGKLRILVVGPAGIGKSSLISAIAQSSEHIVHVDQPAYKHRTRITETYASTRPFPWWQSEMDPSLSARRLTETDEVLDRNLCFVECPSGSRSDSMHPAIRYVESKLFPMLNRPINDGDLWKLLGGGADPIVDAILYLIPSSDIDGLDITHIKALQVITNVIPLLARSDQLGSEDITAAKRKISQKLGEKKEGWFSFSGPRSQSESSDIFAVSSVCQSDREIMDASTLMNPEYATSLFASELPILVKRLLSPDGCARLRHSAALKCIRWRRHRSFNSPFYSIPSNNRFLMGPVDLNSSVPENSVIQYQNCRPMELRSWAESLRHSLDAERHWQTFQCLGPHELASGLSLTKIEHPRKRRKNGKRKRTEPVSPHQDPLGLLGLAGQLKYNGKHTLQLLSGTGVIAYISARIYDMTVR